MTAIVYPCRDGVPASTHSGHPLCRAGSAADPCRYSVRCCISAKEVPGTIHGILSQPLRLTAASRRLLRRFWHQRDTHRSCTSGPWFINCIRLLDPRL